MQTLAIYTLCMTSVHPVISHDTARGFRGPGIHEGDILAAQPTVIDMIVFDDMPWEPPEVNDCITGVQQGTVPDDTTILGGLFAL
jgi:hypothetical protein